MSYQWLMRNSDDFGLDKRSQRRMREIDLERAKEAQNGVKTKRTVSSPKYPQRAGNALESFLRTNRV